jgi:hypothetical protein
MTNPGRWYGLTAEQPVLSFQLAQRRRATPLGFQHSENTMPPPRRESGWDTGSHPAPFRCRERVHGPRVTAVQARQPQKAV